MQKYPLAPETIQAINDIYGSNYVFIVIRGEKLTKENIIPHLSFCATHTYQNNRLVYPTYRYTEDETENANCFWDHRIISVNSVRKAGMGGGGKTPAEMLDDMKKRHASGSFVDIVPHSVTWGTFIKQIPIKMEDFNCVRIQRIVATHPNIDYYIDLMN